VYINGMNIYGGGYHERNRISIRVDRVPCGWEILGGADTLMETLERNTTEQSMLQTSEFMCVCVTSYNMYEFLI
jgi:hypothetical protein